MEASVAASERVPTGPLKLGEDWPGIFIRGDEALGMASDMKKLADAIDRGDEAVIKSSPRYLRRIASILEACRTTR